jgi:hypothetical protein
MNLTGVLGAPYLIESYPRNTRYGALVRASESIIDWEKDSISTLGPDLMPRAFRLLNPIYGMPRFAVPQNCSVDSAVGFAVGNPYAAALGLPTIAWNGSRIVAVPPDTEADYVPVRLVKTTQNIASLVPVNLPVGLSWIDPFKHAQMTSPWSDWRISGSAWQGLSWQGNFER